MHHHQSTDGAKAPSPLSTSLPSSPEELNNDLRRHTDELMFDAIVERAETAQCERAVEEQPHLAVDQEFIDEQRVGAELSRGSIVIVDTPQAWKHCFLSLKSSSYIEADSETVGEESLQFWAAADRVLPSIAAREAALKKITDTYNEFYRSKRRQTFLTSFDRTNKVSEESLWRQLEIKTILDKFYYNGISTPLIKKLRSKYCRPSHAVPKGSKDAVEHYERRLKAAEGYYNKQLSEARKSKSGLHFWENRVECVQLRGDDGVKYLVRPSVMNATDFETLLNNVSLLLVYNGQFDLRMWTHHFKIKLHCKNMFDCYVAERMLTNGILFKDRGLAPTLLRRYGIEMDKGEQVSNWSKPWTAGQILYAAADVTYLHKLYLDQRKELEEQQLNQSFILQMNVLPLTVDIELAGLCVDREKLLDYLEWYKSQNKELHAQIASQLPVNWRSNKDLLEYFQQFNPEVKSVDKSAMYSLSKEHPICELILEDRSQLKMMRTYLEPFKRNLVDNKDHFRIHGNFNVQGADTGRYSSSGPNLQNLPSGEFRTVFRARPGYKFVDADLSSIEPRILAEFSQDERLIQSFVDGEDPYIRTASLLYNKPYDSYFTAGELNADGKDVRSPIKAVMLGCMYGKTKYGLAHDLGCTPDYAQYLIKKFFWAMPSVERWIEAQYVFARENEFVRTVSGWKRHLPDINSTDRKARARAERQVINTIIQGGSADMMKESIIIFNSGSEDLDMRLIMTLHDEEAAEAREDLVDCCAALLSYSLVQGCKKYMPTVPVVAEPVVVDTWAEAK